MGVSPTEGKISTGRIGGGVKRASNKGSVTRLPRGSRSEVSVKRFGPLGFKDSTQAESPSDILRFG